MILVSVMSSKTVLHTTFLCNGVCQNLFFSRECALHGTPIFCRYLFIFLKFVASVIPTIEYDYTMDFDLGHS
jgi:hypothetical protein